MVGWHHQINGHESEEAPGVGEGQGSLACCSPWGHKELNTAELLSNNRGQTGDEGNEFWRMVGSVANRRLPADVKGQLFLTSSCLLNLKDLNME